MHSGLAHEQKTKQAVTASYAVTSKLFTINGRFYLQEVTGVQRYAREIVQEIDDLLSDCGARGLISLPARSQNLPEFTAIEPMFTSGTAGHVWEQAILPVRATEPILNLCNTGPLLARRQVVCMHDVNVFAEPASYRPVFRTFYRHLLPQLARRGARITTVSKFSSVQLAKRLSINVRDIEVMYNGHEHVGRWDAAASGLSKRLAGHRPFVLLLGSRARHKNAQFILHQAEALNDLGLDLVVAGGSSQIFSAIEAVEGRNIRWLGFVSDHDLAWLYLNAVCLAFPSRSEGFGLPIVEAMALGCPVVASNQSCLPEICGGAALLGGPDDVAVWQKHFRSLIESRDLGTELRGKGRERVAAFSWRSSAQSYLDLISRLC